RPRGARPRTFSALRSNGMFQSTRPRGARHRKTAFSVPHSCFNPRAREGRDLLRVFDLFQVRVSIHAPARGATCVLRRAVAHIMVSTHAPARGATRPPPLTTNSVICFNPRAREGRDASRCADRSG